MSNAIESLSLKNEEIVALSGVTISAIRADMPSKTAERVCLGVLGLSVLGIAFTGLVPALAAFSGMAGAISLVLYPLLRAYRRA